MIVTILKNNKKIKKKQESKQNSDNSDSSPYEEEKELQKPKDSLMEFMSNYKDFEYRNDPLIKDSSSLSGRREELVKQA